MRCRLQRFALTKAVPLTISRGTTAAVEHALFTIHHDGITGMGETGGFDAGHRRYDTEAIAAELGATQTINIQHEDHSVHRGSTLIIAIRPGFKSFKGYDLSIAGFMHNLTPVRYVVPKYGMNIIPKLKSP